MHVLLAVNERSGRGRAAIRANRLEAALHARDVKITRLAVQRLVDTPREPPPDALVLVGGDGTVSHSLPLLTDLDIPMWHCPAGTENLIARSFGMNVPPNAAASAIEAADTTPIDLGLLTTGDHRARPFAIMVSVGPDAEVVHAVDAARLGSISHLSYVRPSIRAILGKPLKRLRIAVDGVTVVDGQSGMAVIANLRAYGASLDWLARADPSDGLLDLAFLPGRTPRGLIRWALRAWLRRPLDRAGATIARGRSIEIESPDGPVAIQADGEPIGMQRTLAVAVQPSALSMLAPPRA